MAMEDGVTSRLFRGTHVGDSDMVLLHLFYADDALFLGAWDERNVLDLISILRCFYMVFGL